MTVRVTLVPEQRATMPPCRWLRSLTPNGDRFRSGFQPLQYVRTDKCIDRFVDATQQRCKLAVGLRFGGHRRQPTLLSRRQQRHIPVVDNENHRIGGDTAASAGRQW